MPAIERRTAPLDDVLDGALDRRGHWAVQRQPRLLDRPTVFPDTA